MPHNLDEPNTSGGITDHSDWITALRADARSLDAFASTDSSGFPPMLSSLSLQREAMARRLAADLLEAHDETGISLDGWDNARQFVETMTPGPILESGV